MKWLGKDLITGVSRLEKVSGPIQKSEAMSGPKCAAMPITTDDRDYDHALLGDTRENLDIEITLDSGCVEHLMDAGGPPGYVVASSAGS